MENNKRKKGGFSYVVYRIIRFVVWVFYPRVKIVGAENLPRESCIIVGNHAQAHAPIVCELYFPRERMIWAAGEMMDPREVPDYAYDDFWRAKPKYTLPFFRMLSYLIAPFAAAVFCNAHTIRVYHDARILSAFRESVHTLSAGTDVIVFPEGREKYNHIVNAFQDKFIDVAKLYYKRTGRTVSFVPLYTAPRLKTVFFGRPIPFDPDAPFEQERERLRTALMEAVTEIAIARPKHTVIPYDNIPHKQYRKNREED